MREQVIEIEDAFAFLGPQVAARNETAKPPPGWTIARIGEDVRGAVGKDETRAGMIAERRLLLALDEVGTHHAGNGIAITEADSVNSEMRCLQYQLLGMRGAAQKRKIRGDGKLDVAC